MDHEIWMRKALNWAEKAARKNEVPVGAVLVKNGRIVAFGHNQTRGWKDPTAHAEMVVLRKAIKKIGNERFTWTSLYVTLEPCPMCAGAIVQARIPEVVYGAKDPKAGACGSAFRILPSKKLNHRPKVVGGVFAMEAAMLLKSFFQARRGKIRKSRVDSR